MNKINNTPFGLSALLINPNSSFSKNKIVSNIVLDSKGNNNIILKKVEDKEELKLKLKPKLNNKNLMERYRNLEVLTTSILPSVRTLSSAIQAGAKMGAREVNNIQREEVVQDTSYLGKNTNKSFDILREETIAEIKSIKEHKLISAHKRYYTRLHPKLKDFSTEVSSLLKSFYTLDVFRAKSQSVVYNYNKQNKKLIKNIESILHNCFSSMRSLISRPILEITANKIIIHIFFFLSSKSNFSSALSLRKTNGAKGRFNNRLNSNSSLALGTRIEGNKRNKFLRLRFKENKYTKINFLKFNKNLLELLLQILSKYLKKNVELDLTRLHYPVNEGFVLAKAIGILGNKFRRRFKYFVNASFKSAKIDNPNNYNLKRDNQKSLRHNASSSITGINMKLGGRILAQKIVPRFTSQTFQDGSLTRTNANIVTSSRFTSKNRKGTYSISVSIGHRFF